MIYLDIQKGNEAMEKSEFQQEIVGTVVPTKNKGG